MLSLKIEFQMGWARQLFFKTANLCNCSRADKKKRGKKKKITSEEFHRIPMKFYVLFWLHFSEGESEARRGKESIVEEEKRKDDGKQSTKFRISL